MFTNRVINTAFLVLSLIFTIVFATMVIITRERTNRIINELSIDRIEVSMSGFHAYLDNMANQARLRAETFAGQERLLDAINDYYASGIILDGENTEFPQYETLLTLSNEFLRGYDFLSITDVNGIALVRTDNGEADYPLPKNGYSLLPNPDVRQVFETGEHVTALTFMLDNTTLVSTTLYPIYDGDTLIGMITILYNLTNPKYINAYKEQSGSEVAIFLGREEFISTLRHSETPKSLNPQEIVFEAIYEQKETSYISFIPIDDVMYGTCFSPLIYHDEIIGMIFTGVDVNSAIEIRTEMDTLARDISITALIIVVAFISVVSRYSRVLKQQIILQNLMTRISQKFLSDDNIDELINSAFRDIGLHMNISTITLYKVESRDPIVIKCSNEWSNPAHSMQKRLGEEFTIPAGMADIYMNMKGSGLTVLSSDNPEVRKIMDPYRAYLRNYLSTPILLDEKIFAVIDFARHKKRKKWSKDDINVFAFVTNILTSTFSRKMVEQQYITAKEKAERNSRYKTSFLTNVSHELRTPMNAILGITEICLRDKTSQRDIESSLNMIYDSGNLLLGIVNDILDLSKIEAGKMEIIPVNYSLPSLINDTVQLCRLRYGSKPINFVLDIDKNTPLNLVGDEVRIKQVLNNIISNAFKYTDTGEIRMFVSANRHISDTEHPSPVNVDNGNGFVTLMFRVKDTGRGMTAEEVEKLYDEFTRFNLEDNHGTVGTGLGMSITKQLVELMNGEINVESTPGVGTVFTVNLPQQSTDSAVCGPDMSERLNSFRYHSISLAKKAQVVCEYMPYGKVLIVDDVESNLFVAKGMLIPYGLQIDTATSGFEAIDYIAGGKTYDIIYMDHMMPKMSGVETVRNLREIGYSGTIIALTANAIVGQAEMFLQNGFDGYIPKPIDSRELNATLIEYVRNKQKPEVINAAREEAREAELLKTIEDDTGDDTYSNITDDLEIMESFVIDAKRAVSTLEKEMSIISLELNEEEDTNIELYRITTHGMKSALRNIGEKDLAELAYKLELAAVSKDYEIITSKTPELIYKLKLLIDRYDE